MQLTKRRKLPSLAWVKIELFSLFIETLEEDLNPLFNNVGIHYLNIPSFICVKFVLIIDFLKNK